MFKLPIRYINLFLENQRRCNRGQGGVEYAGALLVSTALSVLVLVICPNPFTDSLLDLLSTALITLSS